MLTATTSPTTTTVADPGLVTVDTTAPSTTTYTATGPIATTGVTAVNLTSTGGALTFTPAGTNTIVVGNVVTGDRGILANGSTASVTTGNITFDDNEMNSLRGRAHVRATFAGPIAPFIEARAFHEFRGDTTGYGLRAGFRF